MNKKKLQQQRTKANCFEMLGIWYEMDGQLWDDKFEVLDMIFIMQTSYK